MKRKASASHDEAMVRELRDNPEFAAEYLRAALEDKDEPAVLLVALRRIAEAQGGIAKVAKAAGIERESLYRALSTRGNPRLSTLVAVAKAMGLKVTLEPDLYKVTIAKVRGGYKIEPTSHVASSLQETHRWIRANFQITQDEWSKLKEDLETSGITSIDRSAGKGYQLNL